MSRVTEAALPNGAAPDTVRRIVSFGSTGTAGQLVVTSSYAVAGTALALGASRLRTQFGTPIAAFQLTRKKFADMAVALAHARLTARRLGELKDAGRGITTEYPALRHAVNLETVYTYEGTHEVHTLVLGAQLTGIDACR